MKKLLSIISAVSLMLSCTLLMGTGDVLAETATDQSYKIRPLITFEESDSILKSYNMLSSDGKFNGLFPSGKNIASFSEEACYSKGKSVKLSFGAGESYGSVKTELVPKTNKPLTDWTNTKYVQMWTKNSSSVAVLLDSLKIKQEGKDFSYKNGSKYSLLKKGETAWTEVSAIAEKDNATYGSVVIPANFEGFIRIAVADFSYPNTTFDPSQYIHGIDFWFYMSDGQNAVIYIDDISLVGNNLPVDGDFAGTTKSDKDYFKDFTTPDGGDEEPTGELNVRPIITFNEDKEMLTAIKMLQDNGDFKGLNSGSSTIISDSKYYSESESARIRFNNSGSYAEICADALPSSNKPLTEWKGSEYIQFWAKNTSNSIILLDVITLKQVGYNARLQVGTTYSLLNKKQTVWIDQTTIPEKDNNSTSGSVEIPAGFEGFVRIKLSNFKDGAYTFNPSGAVTGFSFWYFMVAGNSQTLFMDDIAIVGKALSTDPTCVSLTKTETEYFKKFYEETSETGEVEKVKVISSFEDKTLEPVWGINWVPYEFSYDTRYKYSGERSYMAKVSSDPQGIDPYSQFEIDFTVDDPLANWEDSEYMMLWVKNISLSPIRIGSLSLVNIQGDMLQAFANSNIISMFKNGAWESVPVTTDSEIGMNVFELPACYEGFIRVRLDQNEGFSINAADIFTFKFFVINSDAKSAILFDDLSIVGTELKASDGVKPLSEYLGTYQGGIVNSYNLSDFKNIPVENTDKASVSSTSPKTGEKGPSIVLLVLIAGLTATIVSYGYKYKMKTR